MLRLSIELSLQSVKRPRIQEIYRPSAPAGHGASIGIPRNVHEHAGGGGSIDTPGRVWSFMLVVLHVYRVTRRVGARPQLSLAPREEAASERLGWPGLEGSSVMPSGERKARKCIGLARF